MIKYAQVDKRMPCAKERTPARMVVVKTVVVLFIEPFMPQLW